MTEKIVAIIPAAGKGKRYGMPKINAVIDGKTFLEHIMDTLTQAGITKIIVVRDIETNDMLDSIRTAINESSENPSGWLIFPVDHPLIRVETIKQIIAAFRKAPDRVIVPQYNSKNGHPIIFPSALKIPEGIIDGGLKSVINESGFSKLAVSVDDKEVLNNKNYREDI